MPPAVHPGRLLKRELSARQLSANRLALDIGVPSGRITDILNARRSITADTAVRLGRYFGNSAQFWLDLQGQYDIAVVEREHGAEISRRVPLFAKRTHSVGLDARHRDREGELRHKRGDTQMDTLRKTYGSDFAKGYRGNVKLREVSGSLSHLTKPQKTGGR